MKDIHIAVGVLAITLSTLAGVLGAWLWWRGGQMRAFWLLVRAAQIVLVVQVALGGVLVLLGHKPPGLHVLYGVLPLLVSLFGEQFRIASAMTVLNARGFESAKDVATLPENDQRSIALAIIHREVGVMTLALLVIVVLLARAAATA